MCLSFLSIHIQSIVTDHTSCDVTEGSCWHQVDACDGDRTSIGDPACIWDSASIRSSTIYRWTDGVRVNTDATSKLDQLKASSGGDRKVYQTVEEFMVDRQMLIDLVVARRQNLRVSPSINVKLIY